MKSLSLFKRIVQHIKDQISNPESDNDLSYEDALLDWKLRRFMQAEYGHAEPPQGVFGRVLAAIKAGGSTVGSTGANFGTLIKGLAVRFYNILAKPTAPSRILPGVVAFALVVMVLSTNTNNNIFNTNYNDFVGTNVNNNEDTINSRDIITREQKQQEKREQTIRRGSVPEGLSQFYPSATVAFYHPVERHMSIPKKHVAGTNEQIITSDAQYMVTTKNDGF